MTPFIEIEGLEHIYRRDDGTEVAAVRGVDLTIARGGFVALIGPNGSGKSTLARHLNALLRPTSGRVWVDGLLTDNEDNLWSIRRRVGMVFQNPENQIVASTVEEDVAFGPENWALPPAEIRRRVDEALVAVGLGEQGRTPPQMLSGGQKQLLAVAGALAARPECIVFDEPTAMLDPRGRRQVMGTIQRLNAEEGLTVVLITHDMDEAAAAQRVLAMYQGRVVMDGPPREIFAREEHLRSIGLGLPPVAEIAQDMRRLGIPLPPGVLAVADLTQALQAYRQAGATPC